MKFNVGFLEIMLLGGIYLYNHSLALSLTLIIIACLFRFINYILEYEIQRHRREKVDESVEGITNSIKTIFGPFLFSCQ